MAKTWLPPFDRNAKYEARLSFPHGPRRVEAGEPIVNAEFSDRTLRLMYEQRWITVVESASDALDALTFPALKPNAREASTNGASPPAAASAASARAKPKKKRRTRKAKTKRAKARAAKPRAAKPPKAAAEPKPLGIEKRAGRFWLTEGGVDIADYSTQVEASNAFDARLAAFAGER